jgi:D-amino peptidase
VKVYILADMEGISGIRVWDQTRSDAPRYFEGRRLMMRDINAAVAGAFDGGAEEVVACDTHGGGGQVELAEMDERAVYEMPTPNGGMMPALDESFSGVILLGHHARAGTVNGFLDHTMNSREVFEVRINDRVVGEAGIEAAYAGHYGVPVIMVSGDAATASEARELLGDVECAVVKWGLCRNKARCMPVGKANELIRATAARAVQRAREKAFRPFRPALPATIEMTLYRSDYCERYVRAGVERVDARTVRRTIESLEDVFRW